MIIRKSFYKSLLLIFIQGVLVSLTSCHSMYGVFENGTQTFRVNPDHTFSWSWSSHVQYLFSDGRWWQERDSNQQQIIYHFASNVTDVAAFPIKVKARELSSQHNLIFRFKDITLPSTSSVHIELHVNENIYPIDSMLVCLPMQPIDSFYISIYHTHKFGTVVPYPTNRELRTVSYYPNTKSNDFTIQFYKGKTIGEQTKKELSISSLLNYVSLDFEGSFITDDYSLEKMWHITPERPIYLYRSEPKTKSGTFLRRRSTIIKEWKMAN